MNCQHCNRSLPKACVHGWGNPNSRLMVIGEAPGQVESQRMEPFCGPAGQVLENALIEIGVNKADLWITNTVCYMPTKAGKMCAPEPEEIRACQPHLMAEIGQIKPKMILALGAVACTALTGQTLSMGQMHGKIYPSLKRYDQTPVYCCYHPSFIRRQNYKMLPQFVQVVKQACLEAGYISRDSKIIEFKVLDFEQGISYIRDAKASKKLLAFDLETTGGDPRTTSIIGISFCYTDNQAIYIHLMKRDVTGGMNFVEGYQKFLPYLLDILSSPDNPKSAFNCKYELQVCESFWGIKVARIVIDPMLAYAALHEEERYPSLDLMTKLYFPEAKTIKSEIKGRKLKDYSLLGEEIGVYGAEDSFYCWKLCAPLRRELMEVRGYTIG